MISTEPSSPQLSQEWLVYFTSVAMNYTPYGPAKRVTPHLDLEPLFDTIDPECLDGVFTDRDQAGRDVSIAFHYARCHVSVTKDTVLVRTDLD